MIQTKCGQCEWAIPRGDEKGKPTFICHGGPPSATCLNGMTTTAWPVVFEGDVACRVFTKQRKAQPSRNRLQEK